MVFCGLRLDFLKKQEVGVVCSGCKTIDRGAVFVRFASVIAYRF